MIFCAECGHVCIDGPPGVLDVAYDRYGTAGGWPVVLLHGFPYDVRCYDDVARRLASAGADVVVPYLRGYGATRFVDESTMRSGQQAALAHDVLALIETLDLDRPVVGGFDWGGRAACLVSMLWPERVSGLVAQTATTSSTSRNRAAVSAGPGTQALVSVLPAHRPRRRRAGALPRRVRPAALGGMAAVTGPLVGAQSPVVVYLSTERDVALARMQGRRAKHPDNFQLPDELATAYLDHFQPPTEDEGRLRVVRT